MTPLPEPRMLRANEPAERIDVLPPHHQADHAPRMVDPDPDLADLGIAGPPELDVPNWLEEGEKSPTLDFPERGPAMRLLDHREQEKAAVDDRVAHLFPRPDTDWNLPRESNSG